MCISLVSAAFAKADVSDKNAQLIQASPPFMRTQESASELLQFAIGNGKAIVWHLYHSGFALRTAHHLLIFDYWPGNDIPPDKKGLAAGLIDPNEIKGEDVIVFISHEHEDHFYRNCIEWKDKVKTIHYVVPPEVSRTDNRFASQEDSIISIAPNNTANIKDVWVKTLLSTDSGVAFLVKTDGLTIYHSGDHACWNWNNDPNAESHFVTELLKPLDGEDIDIAMHVCDPRLKASGWGGIGAFTQKYKPRMVAPMHLWGKYKETQEIESFLKSIKSQSSFWAIQGRGDCVIYQREKAEKPSGDRKQSKQN